MAGHRESGHCTAKAGRFHRLLATGQRRGKTGVKGVTSASSIHHLAHLKSWNMLGNLSTVNQNAGLPEGNNRRAHSLFQEYVGCAAGIVERLHFDAGIGLCFYFIRRYVVAQLKH